MRIHSFLALCLCAVANFASAATYSQDAEPILTAHCVECHHTGGHAPDLSQFPFPATTDQASVVTKIIAATSGKTAAMPPGVRTKLSGAELQTLTSWQQGGLEP